MVTNQTDKCLSCQNKVTSWFTTLFREELSLLSKVIKLKHLQKHITSYVFGQDKHTIHYIRDYKSYYRYNRDYRCYLEDIEICSGCFQYGLYMCIRSIERLPYQCIHHDYFIQRHLYQEWCKNKTLDNESDDENSILTESSNIIRADDSNYKSALQEMTIYSLPQHYYCVYKRQPQPQPQNNSKLFTISSY